MTRIIVAGLSQDTFSLLVFYVDRARRIIPALLVLCICLLVLGWFFLLSKDYSNLGSHVASSLAFVSNIKYWKESGYFASASHEKWLLHTWSLSAEWQFYIFLPLGIMLVWRLFGERLAKYCFMLAGVLSFALSTYISQQSPDGAFYLLPARAWEMIAGGMTWWVAKSCPCVFQGNRAPLAVCGLILIVSSVFVIDSTFVWPGANASWPVVGTILILLANNQQSFLVSNTLIQRVGTASYSIYLWHWPLVVALNYARADLGWIYVVGGIVLSIILGELSFRYIEAQSQRRLGRFGVMKQCLIIGLPVFVVLAFALVITFHKFEGRTSDSIEEVARSSTDMDPRAEQCWESADARTAPLCHYGPAHTSAIIIGDSHAGSTVTALEQAAIFETGKGVDLYATKGCPTLLSAKRSGYECDKFNSWLLEAVAGIDSTIPAIIVNRYSAYLFGLQANEEPKSLVGVPIVHFDGISAKNAQAFEAQFKKELISTACALAEKRTVYLVRPIPEMRQDVPRSVALDLLFGGGGGDVSISLHDYHRRQSFIWEAQDQAAQQCGVKILDPTPYLCDQQRCWGSKDGKPLYFDDDHLNESGNKLLVPMFRQAFKDF